ncbi:hypothetical protein [Pusillimonas sp. ANT_WB101]|uniref:hypothetical protein n=1 Tax=Pusillimonas sp. ANT_WB101 TaxID=2597356 RepID=UPI0011EC1E47|nr:hypothetical protein [Pusillimonas sp. ANT_WB101]KAA0910652.1 hypothetical protein FQ179_01890 [Pusillimonas sp. ANT_WB101]
MTTESVLTDATKEAVDEAVAHALGDAYDCNRVWEAWSYNTMGRDDFSLITEDSDRLREVSEAAIKAVLQSPEVQRLRNIEKAALDVLSWTQAKHRPPVREALPCGESVTVRVHALADLHDALHPDSPAKTAGIKGRS